MMTTKIEAAIRFLLNQCLEYESLDCTPKPKLKFENSLLCLNMVIYLLRRVILKLDITLQSLREFLK